MIYQIEKAWKEENDCAAIQRMFTASASCAQTNWRGVVCGIGDWRGRQGWREQQRVRPVGSNTERKGQTAGSGVKLLGNGAASVGCQEQSGHLTLLTEWMELHQKNCGPRGGSPAKKKKLASPSFPGRCPAVPGVPTCVIRFSSHRCPAFRGFACCRLDLAGPVSRNSAAVTQQT